MRTATTLRRNTRTARRWSFVRLVGAPVLATATAAALLLGASTSASAAQVTGETPAAPASLSGLVPLPCWFTLCLDRAPDGSLTASSITDVGPTPWYLSVWNATTGQRLAYCGTGTSCTAPPPSFRGCDTFVSYISAYPVTFPPSYIQQTSRSLVLCDIR